MEILAFLAGLVVGAAVAWAVSVARRHPELSRLEAARAAAEARTLEVQRTFETAERRLADAFHALAADALRANTEGFLALAHEKLGHLQKEAEAQLQLRAQEVQALVSPVRESLERVGRALQDIETARQAAYLKLAEGVEKLQAETATLVTALRKPEVRGRWGEIQLRRVVELAGMQDHVDFVEQETVSTEDGRLRPDLIVKLPGGKNIVVDSKVPLVAYLEALDLPPGEDRAAKLREHARQVRAHVLKLSQKRYFEQFSPAPEFVVLFLPGESFFSAALDHDPALLEDGVSRGVILATPMTLIALMKAAYYGWKQEAIARDAQRIFEAGRELHERTATMCEHFSRVGSSLRASVEAFNDAVGSLESRVLPAARRLRELGASGQKELKEILKVDIAPREASGAVP